MLNGHITSNSCDSDCTRSAGTLTKRIGWHPRSPLTRRSACGSSRPPQTAIRLRVHICVGASLVLGALAGPSSAAPQKSPDSLTVVALGTSLTANGGWLDAIEKTLKACHRQDVRLLNFGASAKTSAWGRQQIERVIAAHPDILLIEFAINDAHLLKGMSRTEARDNIRTIVAGVKRHVPDVRVHLLSMNPVHGLRAWLRPRYNDYNDDYAELAAQLGARWIDLRPVWATSGLDLAAAIPDGVHPTQGAAREVVVREFERATCVGAARKVESAEGVREGPLWSR